MNRDSYTVEFHSTPQLYVAYRKGQCFCLDCQGKVPIGMGKTAGAAIAALERSQDGDERSNDEITATNCEGEKP